MRQIKIYGANIMDNVQNSISKGNKQKFISCLKGCLILFLGIIIVIFGAIFAIGIIDHIPQIVDSQVNEEYAIELYSKSSPDWPFGPQDGKIVLKKNAKTICQVDFELWNDGKNMNQSNWKVDWKNDKAIVTIIGEEQKDEVYYLYYDGELPEMNSDLS